jgi:hypothetical protein
MLKELKYFFYTLIIFVFFFLTLKYYFSDENKKNSYRSFKKVDEKVIDYSKNLILLKNDTKDVVKYVEISINKRKKNYNFWKLVTDNVE